MHEQKRIGMALYNHNRNHEATWIDGDELSMLKLQE
jgi:hypothetical protein